MAEQVTPLTNSPLSQESRQIIARSTNVSGQTIRGDNLLSPITPSESEIKNLQVSQKNQESLSQIQTGIFTIQQDINRLNSGLLNIATLLQQDAINEERILRSQQERERRLAEEQVRVGRESEIERKIDSAIVAPVQRIAPKVQNLFGNVLQSLGWLFGGWLTNQVIDYIKAEGEGNNERMVEIKNNILKNLTVAGGILLTVKIGIGALRRTLFGITKQLGSLIGKTVTAPFNALKGLVTGGSSKPTTGGSPKPTTGGSPKPTTGGSPKPTTGGSPKPTTGGILSGIKNFGSGIKNTAGNFVKGMGLPLLTGSVMTGIDVASGEKPERAVAGTVGGMITSGAAFTLGSLLPIPGSGLVSGALAYSPGEDIGKGIYDKFFGMSTLNNNQTNTIKDYSTPVQNTQFQTNQKVNQETNQNIQGINPGITQEIDKQKSVEIDKNLSPIQNQLLLDLKSLSLSEPSTNQTPQENKISSGNINQKINFPNYSNFFNLSINESSPKILGENNQSTQFDLLDTKNIFDNQTNLDSYSKVFDEKNSSNKFILQKTDQISSIPKSDFKLGELPEPKPNIVYASTNSSSNSSTNSSSGPIGSSGVLADVPLIAPNNPDNFQILLAHSIYNVVV